MLFLHGGPGSAESLFSHAFQENWDKFFTVVHWDQHGSGKTLSRNKDSYPTIYLMIKDLSSLVKGIKANEKIFDFLGSFDLYSKPLK